MDTSHHESNHDWPIVTNQRRPLKGIEIDTERKREKRKEREEEEETQRTRGRVDSNVGLLRKTIELNHEKKKTNINNYKYNSNRTI